MEIRSRFNKGNVVQVLDYIAESERIIVIKCVEDWNYKVGFTYVVRDYGGLVDEKYDDCEFNNNFEIHRFFRDVNDYERWAEDESKR